MIVAHPNFALLQSALRCERAALEDKIVQKAIARVLEAVYEADFMDFSYGFRPKRSCHQALKALSDTIMFKPVNHVIEADIKGFFDNVSHDWMMKFLEVRIKDSSLLLLIRRFLKAGYMEAGQRIRTNRGTPQGGNLTPHAGQHLLALRTRPVVRETSQTQCPGPVPSGALCRRLHLHGPAPADRLPDRSNAPAEVRQGL
ncbi:MAG: hypothetical protein H8E73_05740 [Planctomycetes bacterium]|nr:hypothetical protein [Planctomycetota bacterium]MBL7154845.1 hypothetical protein [Phycisphaerae bacterium]